MTPKKKEKRLALILLIIGAAPLIAAIILLAVQNDTCSIIAFFSFCFSAFFIFAALAVFNNANKLYCKHCEEKYDYDHVRWQVEETFTNSQGNIKYANVDFEIVCPHCGQTREYTKKYEIARIDENGHLRETNLENKIRKQFK